ncbi:transposase [Streptomyces sp. NPDC002536]
MAGWAAYSSYDRVHASNASTPCSNHRFSSMTAPQRHSPPDRATVATASRRARARAARLTRTRRPCAGDRTPRPCTVVLDNASAHTAKVFKGRRGQLSKIGVDLFHLPPRSPELNDIELVWRQAKYQDYPQRAQTSTDAIGKAVDQAMNRQRDRIRQSATNVIEAT